MGKKGFSLLELVVTSIIIGILATLGFAQYGTYRESTLDREAQANLRLMIAAQRIYRMEVTAYYPTAGGTISTLSNINNNLKLILPAGNWNYQAASQVGPPNAACAQATRVGVARNWRMRNSETDPVSGTCP